MGDSPAETGVCQAKSFQESVEVTKLSPRHRHWLGWDWLVGCCGGSSSSKVITVPSMLRGKKKMQKERVKDTKERVSNLPKVSGVMSHQCEIRTLSH